MRVRSRLTRKHGGRCAKAALASLACNVHSPTHTHAHSHTAIGLGEQPVEDFDVDPVSLHGKVCVCVCVCVCVWLCGCCGAAAWHMRRRSALCRLHLPPPLTPSCAAASPPFLPIQRSHRSRSSSAALTRRGACGSTCACGPTRTTPTTAACLTRS
jgi:hypothetical protein